MIVREDQKRPEENEMKRAGLRNVRTEKEKKKQTCATKNALPRYPHESYRRATAG